MAWWCAIYHMLIQKHAFQKDKEHALQQDEDIGVLNQVDFLIIPQKHKVKSFISNNF